MKPSTFTITVTQNLARKDALLDFVTVPVEGGKHVVRRAELADVAHEAGFAEDFDLREEAIQQATGGTDEGFAESFFVLTRCFAY